MAETEDCEVCALEREECDCWEYGYEDGEDCSRCGGSGWYVPMHCCGCGGGEYDCICCPRCGAQNVGKCPCTLTVATADGGTLTLPGGSP
jgi:hypothetical protein